MKTYHECLPCFLQQAVGTLQMITEDESCRQSALRKILLGLSSMDMNEPPPVTAQRNHRIIREITGESDPFKNIKSHYNKFAISLLNGIKDTIDKSDSRFADMVRLTIAGNIIDFGKNFGLKESDVCATMDSFLKKVIDENSVVQLKKEIEDADTILYLGDNSGEIVFDKFFIEHLPKDKITYVVRGGPIINDVTIQDAEEVGMTSIVSVIDNGSNAPGTILSDCSEEFRQKFENADLVIAKGQGNYETLSHLPKNIYFLLQVKCPVLAKSTGYRIGSFVVKKHECAGAFR